MTKKKEEKKTKGCKTTATVKHGEVWTSTVTTSKGTTAVASKHKGAVRAKVAEIKKKEGC